MSDAAKLLTATKVLDVYRQDERIGQLFNEEPLSFKYDASWLATKTATAISPLLPLSQKVFSGTMVEAYFENLLPEAGIRDLLKLRYQTTTTFGLLSVLRGDSASDLTLLPAGEKPVAASYQPTTWQAVKKAMSQGKTPLAGKRDDDDSTTRISNLAGAQRKKTIYLLQDNEPAFALGTSPTSHIVKPDIQHDMAKIWSSALNETFVMNLAANLGLGVASASYQADIKACVVQRYDRIRHADGSLQRLHQLDLCQLAGVPSTIKYESDGGPGLQTCYALLRGNGVPAIDLKRFLLWTLFNLYVGNHDSHAKNLSIVFGSQHRNGIAGGNEPRLAPFYDLLSTSFYSGLSNTFAFAIGGENRPSSIKRDNLIAMAEMFDFKPAYVLKEAQAIASAMPKALERTKDLLAKIATQGTEQTLLERLSLHIASNTSKLDARWNG